MIDTFVVPEYLQHERERLREELCLDHGRTYEEYIVIQHELDNIEGEISYQRFVHEQRQRGNTKSSLEIEH